MQYAIVEILLNKFIVKNISFEGMQRVETSEYPIAALREMILNALVHRTYIGTMPQLRVYNDKLTFWNEGALPLQISIDSLDKIELFLYMRKA